MVFFISTYFGKTTHKKKLGLQVNGLAPMLCGSWDFINNLQIWLFFFI
jgi:hypothetical protein